MDEKHHITAETLRRRFKRVNSDLTDAAKPKLWEKIRDNVFRNHEPNIDDGPPRWVSQNTLALIERFGFRAKAKSEHAGNVQGNRNGAIHRSARDLAANRGQRHHCRWPNCFKGFETFQPDKLDEQRGKVERGGGGPRDNGRTGAMIRATGYGPDEAREHSSLLAEPLSLLRQTVKNWVSMLEENPADEDYDGASEALIIALECGGYPVTDLFKGNIGLRMENGDGDPLTGDDVLRKTITVLRAIVRKNEDDLRAKGREVTDLKAKLNRQDMLVQLQIHGIV